jgi:hypothetical protein
MTRFIIITVLSSIVNQNIPRWDALAESRHQHVYPNEPHVCRRSIDRSLFRFVYESEMQKQKQNKNTSKYPPPPPPDRLQSVLPAGPAPNGLSRSRVDDYLRGLLWTLHYLSGDCVNQVRSEGSDETRGSEERGTSGGPGKRGRGEVTESRLLDA